MTVRDTALKASLDRLYDSFNAPDSAFDPVQVVQRYPRREDREIVAFIASAVAFGRVASVVNSTNAICAVLGDRPADVLETFRPAREGRKLRPLVHRWTRGDDFVALLWILRAFIREHGSLEQAFAAGMRPGDVDVGPAIERFSARAREVDLVPVYGKVPARPGVYFFFPRPSSGSACKRMNLFLRWMVRTDGVDPGGWTSVPASKLVIPLDTHIIRVGRCLKLTTYQSPGWKMAAQITASLRKLDAADPVRYDFSLCHLGMMGGCRFGAVGARSHTCQLAGVCHPSQRRTRAGKAA
ncbi:MAG: TIGR02757 family protein [Acidobacteriota bacterium]|nr:TIGR02757 family protein [Acidobacteriota bacterium]